MRSSSGQDSTSMQFTNPFAQPLQHVPKKPHGSVSEAEESKGQPAGVAVDDRAHPLRVLVLADGQASFFKLEAQSELVEDPTLPRYPNAKLARFAPLAGRQAAIVDELGLHFVDMESRQESLFISAQNIDSLQYSPSDTFVVTCEKFNANAPDTPNLRIIDTRTGRFAGEFVWRKQAKESLKTLLWSPDESVCLRLAPPEAPTEPNSIEIYRNGEFGEPAARIFARFPRKGKNKKEAPTFVNGMFDGFALCPHNPAQPTDSPQYLFCWQNAAKMSEEDTNGTVFVYDLRQENFDRSKFMIQCHQGQEIQVKINCTGYAALIWSQNLSDTSGKSYYGEHTLQYVQIFGGRDRQHVPVFQNMIQDVAWVASGERFIVIAGNQPAVATLYDKDCNPLFEFGKRYRNTIRICPFSQLLLIGGFGNLKGEIDFWSLDTLEQVGKTRSDCAIGIEWSPNGKYLMCSVFYERVKVDNQISIFSGCGQKILTRPKTFEVLNFAQWQPYPEGTFPAPSIESMQEAFAAEEAKKPKRTFQMPQQSSAFSQMMRAQMSGEGDGGPRKLESKDKKAYKEMGSTQASSAKEKVQAVNEKAKGRNTASARPSAPAQEASFGNWRAGNFGSTPAAPKVDPTANSMAAAEATNGEANVNNAPTGNTNGYGNGRQKGQGRGGRQEQPAQQQTRPKTQCYGADLIIYEDEEKKVSKHAKRRANKKAKQAAAQQDGDVNGNGGQDNQPAGNNLQ